METEIKIESEVKEVKTEQNNSENKLSIPMAIIIAGVLIAGAIFLKNSKPVNIPLDAGGATALTPVEKEDITLGNSKAKVTFILYEDFQCPYCGAVSGLDLDSPAIKYLKQIDPSWAPFVPGINDYVKKGDVLFVYRDWAFLGPESVKASLAARCAKDQNKFWEYHDYLYSHQNGENKGNFSDLRLKSFAKDLNLDTTLFDQCFDENKYGEAIINSKNEGAKAGVNGTPKGFILRNGKVVSTIDGAESWTTVKEKFDAALK